MIEREFGNEAAQNYEDYVSSKAKNEGDQIITYNDEYRDLQSRTIDLSSRASYELYYMNVYDLVHAIVPQPSMLQSSFLAC